MDFHLFVFISTVIFYIILLMYRKSLNIPIKSKMKRSSNLIYVLLIPILMYSYNYFIQNKKIDQRDITESSESLLTKPYPVTSTGSIDTFTTKSS